MEIRKVWKSSASIMPVFFYKEEFKNRRIKGGGGGRNRNGEKVQEEMNP